jgi:UPF0716 protein FxsA
VSTPARPEGGGAGRTISTVALVLLLVPVVEIAVAVAVAGVLGGGRTVLLVLLFSVAGLWLLRREGLGAIRDLRARRPGSLAPSAAADRALKVVAALLLVFPGLLTDVAGLLMLVPPIRAAVAAVLGRRLRRHFDVARRRLTVRGEVVEGVTVTTWIDDAVLPAVEGPERPEELGTEQGREPGTGGPPAGPG